MENQVSIEKNNRSQFQQEMVTKDNTISRLLNIPPPQQIFPNFSTILTELCISHWEKVKQYCPSLQPVLRFLSDVESLCAEAEALISSSMFVVGPKFLVAQGLI